MQLKTKISTPQNKAKQTKKQNKGKQQQHSNISYYWHTEIECYESTLNAGGYTLHSPQLHKLQYIPEHQWKHVPLNIVIFTELYRCSSTLHQQLFPPVILPVVPQTKLQQGLLGKKKPFIVHELQLYYKPYLVKDSHLTSGQV